MSDPGNSSVYFTDSQLCPCAVRVENCFRGCLLKLQNFSANKYESNWQLLVCFLTALALSRGRTGNQFLWHLLRETEYTLEKH